MSSVSPSLDVIERKVIQLFSLVSEAIARSTEALLGRDTALGQSVVDGDQDVDDLTADVEMLVWEQLTAESPQGTELRYLIALLLILPELERSADLAEHIAQRAVTGLGAEMTPRSRGIIQLMTEVAGEMWKAAADAFVDRTRVGDHLEETDEEMDVLHTNLTSEVAAEAMPAAIAAQVTLLARFYERLGDHAVNLARRVEHFLDMQR
jgi:phosphate transport system protein